MNVQRCSAAEVELPPRSVQAIVTSPPYWGKRVYGDSPDEIGSGQSLIEYIRELTSMAHHWRPSLADDGVMWVNIGDTYAGSGGAGGDHTSGSKQHIRKYKQGQAAAILPMARPGLLSNEPEWGTSNAMLAGGQLCLVPFLLASHLQGDGWLIRSMIVWDRGRTRPEDLSHVRRPGDGQHEMILMATKSKRVKFDAKRLPEGERGTVWRFPGGSSNKAGGRGGHVAPFPDELPKRCILSSTDPGDVVFDPFAGSGTTLRVAEELDRVGIGCDLYSGDQGFA